MAQVDPKFSAGARLERRSYREYLRREMAAISPYMRNSNNLYYLALSRSLSWVMKRQARYDKKKGGLGK